MKLLLRSRHGRIGLGVVGLLLLMAVLAALVGQAPNQHHFEVARAPDGGPPLPSAAHWLGTDPVHRDVLARLLAGARVSLTLAIVAGALSALIGGAFGIATAVARQYVSRGLAFSMMRLLDVLFAFPGLLLITAIGTLLGGTSLSSMILVLGLTGWTGIARVTQVKAESVLREDYVLAARALGVRPWRVAVTHVLSNVRGTVLSLGTSNVGSMILAEAVLSYLTVGLPPPDASWGRMLQEAEGFVVTRPLLVFAPATAILLTMLGFHHLGEALAEKPTKARTRGLFSWDLAIVAAVFAVTLLLPPAQLTPPAARASELPLEDRRGGTFRFATAFPIRALDPALATDENSVGIGHMVFGQLLSFDPQGHFLPGFVEQLSWSESGTEVTLHLRPGLRFQDQTPLTALDLKRSIERALGPKVASGRASEFSGLVGFEAFHNGEASELAGVVVQGPERLELRLKSPDATFAARLSMSTLAPVCASVPPPGVAKPTELCGAGPFRVTEFDADRGLVLERNDAYYEAGLPYLDRVELTFNVRPQAQRYRFERGEFDLLREVTSSDAALFRANQGWAPLVRKVERFRVSAIYLDTRKPPFDDLFLRRAVAHAVDPSVLSLVRPEVRSLTTVIPEGVPMRPAQSDGRSFDLERALLNMKAAGYAFDPETGEGGYPEEIAYVTVPNTLEQHAAEIYKEQLAKVGLRVRLHLLTFQAYLAHIRSAERSPMGWAAWQADYADPLTFFDPNLMPTEEADSHNYSGFASQELLQTLLLTRSERDPALRRQAFAEAERIVSSEAPWIPTIQAQNIEVVQPWVLDYTPDAMRLCDLTRTYLAPSARSRGSR